MKNKHSSARKKIRAFSREAGNRPPGEKPVSSIQTAKKLLQLLSNHKLLVAISLFGGIVATVLNIIGPLLLGDSVDAIQQQIMVRLSGQQINMTTIGKTLITLLAIYIGSAFFTFIQTYTMVGITQNIVRDMREKINQKISKLPLKYFDSNTKGEILSRITNDIDNISNTLQNNFTQIVTSSVTLIGVLGMMLYVSWEMTLITLSVIPACLIVAFFIAKRSRKYFRAQWDRTGELNGHIEEMYNGHNIVKVFGHEKEAIDEFNEINDELYNSSRKAQFISGTIMPLLNFINNIGYVMICVAGGVYVFNRMITLGDVTSFITYSKMFTQPISDLGNIANNIQSSLASAERVFLLLDQEDEPKETAEYDLPSPKGEISFENVEFSYSPDKPLIRNFNLHVKPGQLIAIVGPTGAGKTTIVNLLMRFYDVNSGSIKIDGIDIRKLSRAQLRKAFGMVLQDAWLFKGTVHDNIAYSKPDASDQDIKAAAVSAKASSFISTYADGFNMMLDEDGSNISQGQRQLLTIARAVLANPSVLILDEATSSVDTRTELLIQDAMEELMKNKTSFVIAHRLSTIRKADMILVMNDGQIVETGKHQELLDRGGFYAELYKSQFASD